MTDTFVNHKHVIGLRNWPKGTTWKGRGYCCVRVASFIYHWARILVLDGCLTHTWLEVLFYLFPVDKWSLAADFLSGLSWSFISNLPPASAGLGLPAGFQPNSNTSAQNILFSHDLRAYVNQTAHCCCCSFVRHVLFMWLFLGESSLLVRMMVIILIPDANPKRPDS